MFNKKSRKIKELTFRLNAANATAENFHALATGYYADVQNLTKERDQWKTGFERWSDRYDALAAANTNAAAWITEQENKRKEKPGDADAFRVLGEMVHIHNAIENTFTEKIEPDGSVGKYVQLKFADADQDCHCSDVGSECLCDS